MFKFVVQNTGITQALDPSVFPTNTEFVGLIPFAHKIMSDSELAGVDYIPYGSTALINVAADLGWRGCFFNEGNFKYSAAVANRSDMLNGGVMTVREALSMLDRCQPDDLRFVRPDNDLKSFSGQVLNASYLTHMLRTALAGASTLCNKLSPDDNIVVSEVADIYHEHRWFIVGRKVVSGSLYRDRGQLVLKPVADSCSLYQAQELADIWLPHDCCVMDTAGTDHGTRVVEFNCINCSGMYANDPRTIFNAMLTYAEKQNAKH